MTELSTQTQTELLAIPGVNDTARAADGRIAVFTNRHEDSGRVPEPSEFEDLGYTVHESKTMAFSRVVFLTEVDA